MTWTVKGTRLIYQSNWLIVYGHRAPTYNGHSVPKGRRDQVMWSTFRKRVSSGGGSLFFVLSQLKSIRGGG